MTVITIGLSIKSKGIFSNKIKVDKIVINRIGEVNNYIDENDEILVLGNNSYYYLLFDKQPGFKYFFQYPIMKYDKKINDDIEKYIIEKKPKVIIDEEYRDWDMFEQAVNIQTYGEKILEEITQNYEEHNVGGIKYYVLKGE